MVVNGEEVETAPSSTPTIPQETTTAQSTESDIQTEENATDLHSGQHSYHLEQLAYLRSGDKGNTANIGMILWIVERNSHYRSPQHASGVGPISL